MELFEKKKKKIVYLWLSIEGGLPECLEDIQLKGFGFEVSHTSIPLHS